jgi:hypothetical protein
MDDKIKWILLAVGGWFLYDWYSKSQAATPVASPAAPPVGVGPAQSFIPAQAPAPPAAAPPSGNVSLLAGMTNEQVAAFAAQGNADAVAESDRRGLRYNHHQWNWFRQQATGITQPDPELWAPGHTTDLVTASEYLSLRQVAGMGGLGRWGGPILPWSTAWQA